MEDKLESKKTVLQIYCAWCQEFIGEKDGQGKTGITAGMCPKCYQKELAKLQQKYGSKKE